MFSSVTPPLTSAGPKPIITTPLPWPAAVLATVIVDDLIRYQAQFASKRTSSWTVSTTDQALASRFQH